MYHHWEQVDNFRQSGRIYDTHLHLHSIHFYWEDQYQYLNNLQNP